MTAGSAKFVAKSVFRVGKVLFASFAATLVTILLFVAISIGSSHSDWPDFIFKRFFFESIGTLTLLWAPVMWRYLK